MKLNAILLSQFNDKSGVRIIHSYPDNIVTKNQFSLYSQLVLAREEICGKVIAIQFRRQFILLGVPNISYNKGEKKVYERAKYIYSVNILVSKQTYLKNMKKYKEVGKKIAYFFKFLEESFNTIYFNQKNKGYLEKLLKKIYIEMNEKKSCVLSHLSSLYTIIDINFLKVEPSKPKKIKPYLVPITFLTDKEIKEVQSELGRKLLQFAKSGDFNMKKIYEICENEPKQINRFYIKAIQFGLVHLVDMFSLYNRYALTQKFIKYLPKGQLHHELVEICAEVSLKKNNKIEPMDMLGLYIQISRRCQLEKYIEKKQKFQKIDLIKWVRISQIKGIITRVYEKFAVITSDEKPDSFISQKMIQKVLFPKMKEKMSEAMRQKGDQKSKQEKVSQQMRRINGIFEKHLTNMSTVDQICVDLQIDRAKLIRLLNNEKKKQLFHSFYVIED